MKEKRWNLNGFNFIQWGRGVTDPLVTLQSCTVSCTVQMLPISFTPESDERLVIRQLQWLNGMHLKAAGCYLCWTAPGQPCLLIFIHRHECRYHDLLTCCDKKKRFSALESSEKVSIYWWFPPLCPTNWMNSSPIQAEVGLSPSLRIHRVLKCNKWWSVDLRWIKVQVKYSLICI